jgi:hypothetical protein
MSLLFLSPMKGVALSEAIIGSTLPGRMNTALQSPSGKKSSYIGKENLSSRTTPASEQTQTRRTRACARCTWNAGPNCTNRRRGLQFLMSLGDFCASPAPAGVPAEQRADRGRRLQRTRAAVLDDAQRPDGRVGHGRAVALRYCRDLHGRFWRARRGGALPIAA